MTVNYTNPTITEDASLLDTYQSTASIDDVEEDRSTYSLRKTVAIIGTTLLLVAAGTHANNGRVVILGNEGGLEPAKYRHPDNIRGGKPDKVIYGAGNLVGSQVNTEASSILCDQASDAVNTFANTILARGTYTQPDKEGGETIDFPNVPVDNTGCMAPATVTATVGQVSGLEPDNLEIAYKTGRCSLIFGVDATFTVTSSIANVKANTDLILKSESSQCGSISDTANGDVTINEGSVSFDIRVDGRAQVFPPGVTLNSLVVSNLAFTFVDASSINYTVDATGQLERFNADDKTIESAVLKQMKTQVAAFITSEANSLADENLPFTISV